MARGHYYKDAQFLEKLEVAKIKEMIPEIIPLHESIIDELWCDFSTTWYCAGGMGVSESMIETFRDYLLTDKEDGM